MPGKLDGSSWENAFEIKTYEGFINFLERKQSNVGSNEQYYILMNDIDCRDYVYKDKEISINGNNIQHLRGNGHSIKNFFMNNSRIKHSGNINFNSTNYYIDDIVLDSWIIKDSVLGQQYLGSDSTIVNPLIKISNSKISMCMIGSNKTDIAANGTDGLDGSSWYNNKGSKNCGSSIEFVSSSINLKYYPEKYWFEHPYEKPCIFKNMLRMLTFDNSKAKIYLPFSPNATDYYKSFGGAGIHSSRNFCYNARYGMNIRNYSDIELIISKFLIETEMIIHSNDKGQMIESYNLSYFNEVKDSIIKIYPKTFTSWDHNGKKEYPNCVPRDYPVHINLAPTGLTSGKNLLYLDLKNIQNLNGALPKGMEFESEEQSATTAYTSTEDNIRDAEWLLNNGIVCIDTDLNSTTGD